MPRILSIPSCDFWLFRLLPLKNFSSAPLCIISLGHWFGGSLGFELPVYFGY
jgi:hypothetical protein